jgi:hypothetical protein
MKQRCCYCGSSIGWHRLGFWVGVTQIFYWHAPRCPW